MEYVFLYYRVCHLYCRILLCFPVTLILYYFVFFSYHCNISCFILAPDEKKKEMLLKIEIFDNFEFSVLSKNIYFVLNTYSNKCIFIFFPRDPCYFHTVLLLHLNYYLCYLKILKVLNNMLLKMFKIFYKSPGASGRSQLVINNHNVNCY
jgi:hypothetical protein